MIYKKMQRRAILFFWFALFVWGFFAYALLYQMIPDRLYLQNGDLTTLNFHMPVEFETREDGSRLIDTSAYVGDYTVPEAQVDMGSIELSAKLFGIIPIKSIQADVVSPAQVYVSGESIGIYVETDGVMVIGTGNFESTDHLVYAPAQNVLKSGDYICGVNGVTVETKEELVHAVEDCGGGQVILTIRRNGEVFDLYMQPVLAKDNTYKLGVWVRDDLAGIGTLTYISQDGKFGALGHSVTDMDTGSTLEISEGKLYDSQVVGIVKGETGKPGELSGVICYEEQYYLGTVEDNLTQGIFGHVENAGRIIAEDRLYEVGYKQDIEIAPATILCDVNGEIQSYDIKITEVDYNQDKGNKSILFEVTDPELLDCTGGIVQGMSGSPILQNGKVIGAVTHVFVQDAQKGYGIFIEQMLQH